MKFCNGSLPFDYMTITHKQEQSGIQHLVQR